MTWFNTLIQLYDIKISGMIYISTTPDKCHERIKIRSREGENVIDLNYLQLLHEKHEAWFNNSDFKTLTINGNKDFAHIIQDDIVNIETFLK